MEIEQLAREQPRGAGPGPGRPDRRASTRRRPPRSSTRPASRPTSPTRWSTSLVKLWERLHRRGRHPRRGQPAGQDRRRPGRRAGRQGHPRRQRRVPAPGPRGAVRGRGRRDPLEAAAKEKDLNYVKLDGEVGIIGNGAGLVMSTLDVVAYAGEAYGGVQPGQLPRHRRRRLGRGHGQRPGDHPRRPGRQGRCSSTSSAASPPATRSPNGIVQALRLLAARGEAVPSRWSSGWTATTPRRAGASSTDGGASRWSSRWTRWTARPAEPPSWPSWRERTHMAIFLNKESQDHRPGHDRLRGHEAHPPDARRRHQRRRRRQPAQGGPDGRRRRPASRSSAPSPRRWKATGADVIGRLRPAAFAKARGGGGDRRRRSPLRRGHHRGHPGARHRRVLRPRAQRAGDTRIIGPNCPGLISPGQSNAGIIPADITSAGPDRPGLQVRHADLPDDVRAARHRLLHRASASAATRSSAPPTSTAWPRSRTTRTPTRS